MPKTTQGLAQLRASLAAKASRYEEAAATTRENGLNAARRGNATEAARLNGMTEALEQAARDFTVLAETANEI